MPEDNQNWQNLVQYLQQKNLLGIFRYFLDATLPLKILVTQTIWMSQSFFHNPFINQMGIILEDQEKTQEFLDFINHKDLNE